MAITFVEERKKQKTLIWILIIIVFIIAVVWLPRFLKEPFPEGIETPVFEFKKVTINFELLENPILKELQPFERINPYGGDIGRVNPFIPY